MWFEDADRTGPLARERIAPWKRPRTRNGVRGNMRGGENIAAVQRFIALHQGLRMTPQGPLPTGTFLTTLKLEVSTIVTSFEDPLAV